MSSLIHNFPTRKRKRDAILEQGANAPSEVVGGSGQPRLDECSEVQAIVISGSPKMGLNDQPALENITLVESREASPVPAAIQVVHPPEQAIGQPDRAKYTRTERKRPLLPDRMLLNSYFPPRGPAPPMEEVSVLGLEGAQEIIDRWKPFNRGESSVDHFHDLYPMMLRMPVTVRARGQGEEYTIPIPTRTINDDLQQIIEDGMQVRNSNFAQPTELVSLEALYLVLMLFLSYCHIKLISSQPVAAIRNMAFQHREFHTQLRNA